ARRRHEQRPGEVRGGVVEHAGGVGDPDALLRRRRHVDVVVAHRDVGDDLEVGAAGEEVRVEAVHDGRHRAVLALQPPGELFRGPGTIVGVVLDLAGAGERFDDFGKYGAGDQDAGFHVTLIPPSISTTATGPPAS